MKVKRGQGNTIEIEVRVESVVSRPRNITMILTYEEAMDLAITLLGDALPAHMLEESPRLHGLARGIVKLKEG